MRTSPSVLKDLPSSMLKDLFWAIAREKIWNQ
jgi:hypothetical protein